MFGLGACYAHRTYLRFLLAFQNLSHRPHTQRKPISQSLYGIIESQSFYLVQVVKLGNNQAIAKQCICSAGFGSLATRR
jgi:hypothetical protein